MMLFKRFQSTHSCKTPTFCELVFNLFTSFKDAQHLRTSLKPVQRSEVSVNEVTKKDEISHIITGNKRSHQMVGMSPHYMKSHGISSFAASARGTSNLGHWVIWSHDILMAEIPNNQLGWCWNPVNNWIFSISTGDRRISEPATVFQVNNTQRKEPVSDLFFDRDGWFNKKCSFSKGFQERDLQFLFGIGFFHSSHPFLGAHIHWLMGI